MTNGIKVGYPHMEDTKSVLMPQQHLLKTPSLDPMYSKSVEKVLAELRALKESHIAMVLKLGLPS